MKASGKIYEFYLAIKKMIAKEIPMVLIPVVVVSVDKEKAQCEVKEEDGDNYSNVRLKSVMDDSNIGVVLYPKVGSQVLIGRIMNDPNNLFVMKYNEVESALITIGNTFKFEIKSDGKAVLNDGNNEGIPIASKVTANDESIKNYCELLKTSVITGFNAVGAGLLSSGATGATAFSNAMVSGQINIEDIKNQNITH